MEIKPIGYIYNDFCEKFGIPRQSGKVSNISKIIFEPDYRKAEAFRELSGFSHLWILFDFSKSHREEFVPTVRPPRLGGNKKVGVFASRSPFRPNSIGLSAVKLLEIKEDKSSGTVLYVEGADILNGTPVYDIKPYIPYCDCIKDALGGYTEQNNDYKLNVVFLNGTDKLTSKEEKNIISQILSEDPRPSYKKQDTKIYKLKYKNYDISFCLKDGNLSVTDIKIIKI